MCEKNYDFRKKLLQVHRKIEFDSSMLQQENIFCLKEPVTIFLSNWNDEVMSTAVVDFVDFLKTAFNIKAVPTENKENAQLTVCIASESGIELGEAASYRGFMAKADESGVYIYGHDARGTAQGLYYLEDVMGFERAPVVKFGRVFKKPMFSPQMVHSGYGLDEYPDNYLSRIAHEGRDAILVYVRDVNETTTGYRDFNDIIRRASRYGIDVYAYSKLISDKHPSEADAEEYYDNTYGRLFRECPGFKGVTLVGESVEFPSKDPHVFKGKFYENNYEGIPTGKPSPGWYPCEDYPDWVNMIKSVVRKYNENADIVFWTYNWGGQPEEARIKLIENLPTDISLLATYEMFEPRKFGESTAICADYTLSFAGPGRYFESEAKVAKKRGIKLYSMTNTGGATWDFGVVPYEPMPLQWMKRYASMHKAHKEWGLCGIMEAHHYGFYPSFISKLSKWCFWSPEEDMEEILKKILIAEFGDKNYSFTSEALRLWSEAIEYFTPTDADQYGAFRVGPSYPFSMVDAPKIPGRSNICRQNYLIRFDSCNTVLSIRIHDELKSLEKMQELIELGIESLEKAPVENSNLEELLNMGRFIRNTVVTGVNAKKWQILKFKLMVETSKKELQSIIKEMQQLLVDELNNAKSTIPLVNKDSRLGWEPSMHYMTDSYHLEWKIRQVEHTLNHQIEQYKKSLMI